MGAMAPPRPHHAPSMVLTSTWSSLLRSTGNQTGPDLQPGGRHLRSIATLILRAKRPDDVRSSAFRKCDFRSNPRDRGSCGSKKVEKTRTTKTESQGRRQWLPRVVQHPAAASPVSLVTRELRPDERRGDPIPSSSDGSISSSAATSSSRKPSCSSSESAALRASLARVTAASASVLRASAFPASRISVSSRTRRSRSRPAISRRV